jgi:hypothetical protein
VHEHRYLGLAGRLPDERIHHLKTARDWPKVVSRQLDRSEAAFPAKGEPHFATLITSSPKPVTDTTGTLRIRWSVFFPVGIQPLGPSSIPLTRIPHQVSITLHGYFFLDSDRLRIDGLEEGFKPNHQASGGTCLEWNRIVATEGTLARLPEALAAFALNESLSYDQCHELWEALEGASLLSTFRAAICRLNSWRPRWRPDGSTWECLPSESPVLLIPHTPDPNPDYS